MFGSEKTTRRKVLKSAGAGALSVSTLPDMVTAETQPTYVGYAYDPVTHEILGESRGQLTRRPDELRGSVEVLNHSVPVNNTVLTRVNSLDKTGEKVSKFTKEPAAKEAQSLRVKSYHERGISGVLEESDGRRIGFSLVNQNEGSTSNVERMLNDLQG